MSKRIQRVFTSVAAVGVLSVVAPLTLADEIVADQLDALAEAPLNGLSTSKVDDWDGRVGEWWGADSAWIMPFQLPDFGAVDNPFVAASFRGDLAWKNDDSGGELDNVDLYAIDVLRAVGDVMHEDYDAPATLIQDNFFTPESWDWNVVRTDTEGCTALCDFLNAAYAGGAGAGQFVFLRYSYDGTFSVQEAYTVLTSNAGQRWEHPTIEYTLAETTIVADLGDALAEESLTGLSTSKIDDWDGRAGEWWGWDSAWIMPFELPDLGAVSDPFDTVSLRTYLGGVWDDSGGEIDNVDLYALDETRSVPEVYHEDYFAAGTLIQDDYYTPGLATWMQHTTNGAGDATLLAFLNAAYDGGAGVGQFVFLRLSYDGLFDVQEAYTLGAANASFIGEQPAIVYTAGTGCVADFNGDGAVDTQDFLAFLNAWAAGDLLADWNGDGTINTQDFLAYLNDWAAGC
jgi:hypothetical protein